MTFKEPLVVHSERELPQEVMFHLQNSHSYRDLLIPNRYWFKYPEQWDLQPSKDPILGIRAIYIARTIRHVSFNVTVSYRTTDGSQLYHSLSGLTTDSTGNTPLTVTFTVDKYLDSDETIQSICSVFDLAASTAFTKAVTSIGSVNLLTDYSHPTMTYDIKQTPYSTMTITTPANDEGMTYEQLNEGAYETAVQWITVDSDSDDMIDMLSETTATNTSIEYNILWDHYQCYVRSSIAALNTDQFLGHTRSNHYTPIKYYRINAREQCFYVDLYSTRNHDAYVVLPEDNLDDLIIEGVVCFDSSAII